MHVASLAEFTGDIPSSPIRNLVKPQNANEDQNCSPTGSSFHLMIEAGEEHGTVYPKALVRKFYSKQIPPIALEDYLLRLHRFCPMSAAVYLAASSYITRMALVENIIPVTPRNVHRLVLGGLRVAMKVMEDLCYSHKRFATVGGVTNYELTRLEINFCFLMNFDLKVDLEMMSHEMTSIRQKHS